MGENKVLVFFKYWASCLKNYKQALHKQAALSRLAQAVALIMLSQQRAPLGRLLNGMRGSCDCVLHIMPIDSCRPNNPTLGVSLSCGQFPAAWPGPFYWWFPTSLPSVQLGMRSSGPDPINYLLNPADLCCPLSPCSSYWHWTGLHGGLICKFVFE